MDLAAIAQAQPYARLLGVEIIEANADRVVGDLLIKDELCTSTGTLHGGVMMGFCDILGATGAWFALPEGANGTTTIESNTSMMSGPKAGLTIRGVSTPIKIGRRLSIWQTGVTDPDGKQVCLVRQTQLVL